MQRSVTSLCIGLVAITVAATTARGQYVPESTRPSEGGKQILTLQTGGWGVSRLALSPDGKRILSSDAGSYRFAPTGGPTYFLLHDAATGKRLARITMPSKSHFSWGLAFSPDGKQFATALSEYQPSSLVVIWDAENRKQSFEFKVPIPVVTSLAFTPDGKRLVTGGGDNRMYANIRPPGELMVWHADNGERRFHLKGHNAFVTDVAVFPDGKRFASSSWDGTVKVWDLETGKELLTLRGHTGLVRSVAVSPDGKWIVSSASGRFLDQRDNNKGNTTDSAIEPQPVRVWDAETGKEFKDFLEFKEEFKEVNESFGCVAISPDCKRIAAARGVTDRTLIRVWDADTGRVVATLRGHIDGVSCLTFSTDSKRLISGGGDSVIKVWDLTTK